MTESVRPEDSIENANDNATSVENAVGEQAEMSVNAAEDALEAAQKEIGTLKDQILRAMAETENTRRRMKKEMEDAQKYAVASFAKDILDVADNFQRALDAVPKDGADGETLKNLVTGVSATERQLLAVMERFGIRKVESLGQPFDPNIHRVMMEQEDASKPAGTILQVFQPGYMIHDRLLREAMVVVSKGGPVAHKVDTTA
jgi:molecular chaperone GrpE